MTPEPDELRWTDVEEIGYRLFEAHPEVDPLSIGFPQMHGWICELEGFADDPRASSEKILEAILMAWIDERED